MNKKINEQRNHISSEITNISKMVSFSKYSVSASMRPSFFAVTIVSDCFSWSPCRPTYSDLFCKKPVRKHFVKFTGNTSDEFSFFNIVASCRPKTLLTHLFPIHPFSTPWKHQKNVRFSNVFRGWREERGCIGNKCVKKWI